MNTFITRLGNKPPVFTSADSPLAGFHRELAPTLLSALTGVMSSVAWVHMDEPHKVTNPEILLRVALLLERLDNQRAREETGDDTERDLDPDSPT